MPKLPGGPRTQITLKLTAQQLAQLKDEMNRTGLNRTALLMTAWKEYLDRLPEKLKR